jgi:tetratricopeptide (TPR) repeat protein
MVKPRLLCGSALVFGLLAGVASAGSWQGVQIMPRSTQVSIQADNGSPTSMYDISWPATVVKTKGRFLWVQDDGGYSANQAGGWIYCDDVVRLDEARDHFTTELRGGETAWLYWMRGISWESKGEPGVAIIDYQNALRVDPRTTIDDLQIRLGRLFAQEQLLNGRGVYRPELRAAWEDHFKAAQQINPNRPQLFYEWGLALTQACECTVDRRQTPAGKIRGTASAGANASPKVASRGIEGDDDSPAELPVPAAQPKPADKPKPATGTTSAANAPSQPPSAPAASTPAATSPVAAPAVITPRGPTPAGAAVAVQSLDCYEQAEALSPNWWRIPLARAELMLDQCDEESPQGERVAIFSVQPKFLIQLLNHHKRRHGQTPVDSQPSSQAIALRGEEIPSDAEAKAQPAAPTVVGLSPNTVAVLNTAIDDFNRSISLNANALDAYRDRAEVLRLVNRFGEAQESATIACNLCYYRQARSLRTLAQINKEIQHYQAAADYALRAAELTSGDEQQRFLQLWYAYSRLASGDTAKIAVASAQIGFVASRGEDDKGDDNSKTSPPPAHIDPPPGFLPRSGSAVP